MFTVKHVLERRLLFVTYRRPNGQNFCYTPDIAMLLNIAYSRCATIGVACKAFASAGIWPLNRCAFTGVDFVGLLFTDKPLPPMTAGGDEPSSAAPADGDGEILVSMSVPVEGVDEISLLAEYDESPLPTSGAGTGSNMSATVLSTAGNDGPLSTAVPDTNGPTTSSSSNRTLLTNGDGSSSVEGQSPASAAPPVSPSSIRPFPKCGDTSTKKRRKSMKSDIFTAPPFKNQLTAKQMEVEDRRLRMADKQTENLSKKAGELPIRRRKIRKRNRT
jgi:hypothetical protein